MSSDRLPKTVAALERGRADGYHPGAQLVVLLNGALVGEVALGDAVVGRVPMHTDTLLPWFSCTKAITALAVLQQWERGRIALDDRVADHIPEFAGRGKEAVTIRHLLTHTAGLRKVVGGELWRAEWDEALASVCDVALEDEWTPGRRAAYDASGAFFVLGEIVRRADDGGRPFDAYVSEEIFEPLDMADSWLSLTASRREAYVESGRLGVMYDTTERDTPRPREGYALDDGRAFLRVMPAGSGVGPMRDLARFWDALRAGGTLDGQRVLSTAAVEAMTARHRVGMVDETFGMVIDWGLGPLLNSIQYRGHSYGFGKHASFRTAGHGGSQSSHAFCDFEHGLVVALCCNGMPGEARNHRRTQPVLSAVYEDLGLAGRP